MPGRKRPEPSTGRKLVSAVVRPLGRVISRHPSIAGGLVAIVVTFGYVTLNAMHQPEKHPSPWFVTREAKDVAAQFPKEGPIPDRRVTTFRIEHSDPQSTASIPETPPTLLNNTVFQLQLAMRDQGIYSGIADGNLGPRTRTAIQIYQIQTGLAPTGEPTEELLVHMSLRNLQSAPTPQARPANGPERADTSPIWARSQSSAPTAPTQPQPTSNRELIVSIQKGLSNIAYADIDVDGIVGEQTRTAIADFQKHYRLPVTGKPDAAVLEKLREIGAL